jgi:hypothetical protein
MRCWKRTSIPLAEWVVTACTLLILHEHTVSEHCTQQLTLVAQHKNSFAAHKYLQQYHVTIQER